MTIDPMRLRQYLPLAAPIVVVAAGWLLLIAPATSDSARAARDLDTLRQRAAQARAALSQPSAPPPPGDPVAAFQAHVAVGDATAALLEELARLASSVQVRNLLIETGDRVQVARADGPRVSGAAEPDPRTRLFDVPLAYSPVTMAFDGDYAALGTFLWQLRDLATTVEIRNLEVRPRVITPNGQDSTAAISDDGSIHVAMTMFVYSRDAAGHVPATPQRRPAAEEMLP